MPGTQSLPAGASSRVQGAQCGLKDLVAVGGVELGVDVRGRGRGAVRGRVQGQGGCRGVLDDTEGSMRADDCRAVGAGTGEHRDYLLIHPL